ncbi:hypothetical protein B0I35DRAFT_480902 [Stachybotrys elegans]|uniref:Uncharacterized protein n=1 Tax=Stachybotrys elegans TaxID=80388 RepID=A0A8K0SKU7_9HYPO|nr:hypothetical protein B0I35DRAFT_480902 [Stachybotrys elegans]
MSSTNAPGTRSATPLNGVAANAGKSLKQRLQDKFGTIGNNSLMDVVEALDEMLLAEQRVSRNHSFQLVNLQNQLQQEEKRRQTLIQEQKDLVEKMADLKGKVAGLTVMLYTKNPDTPSPPKLITTTTRPPTWPSVKSFVEGDRSQVVSTTEAEPDHSSHGLGLEQAQVTSEQVKDAPSKSESVPAPTFVPTPIREPTPISVPAPVSAPEPAHTAVPAPSLAFSPVSSKYTVNFPGFSSPMDVQVQAQENKPPGKVPPPVRSEAQKKDSYEDTWNTSSWMKKKEEIAKRKALDEVQVQSNGFGGSTNTTIPPFDIWKLIQQGDMDLLATQILESQKPKVIESLKWLSAAVHDTRPSSVPVKMPQSPTTTGNHMAGNPFTFGFATNGSDKLDPKAKSFDPQGRVFRGLEASIHRMR